MNESGGPVKALARSTRSPPERIIAIHDELDIAFGTLRVKLGGGDNGHNGLKSMRSSLGTGDFYRVRVGIGRPPGRQDVADFVLSNYSTAERKELPFQVDRRRRRGRVADHRRPREDPAALQLASQRAIRAGDRQPTLWARPTAASCEETSSLARIDFTWVRTVASETTLSRAMSRTARPFIRCPRTSLSRAVSRSSRLAQRPGSRRAASSTPEQLLALLAVHDRQARS